MGFWGCPIPLYGVAGGHSTERWAGPSGGDSAHAANLVVLVVVLTRER